MTKIYLLRHADAVDAETVGGDDAKRVLTARGEESARRAAEGMKLLELQPDVIWSSPYARAMQTARITAETLGCKDELEDATELEPGADPGVIAGLIQQFGDYESVMLVGHNPDLEKFLQYLISETDQANISLKKGGLAIVEVQRPIHQGCGALVSLWTPKQLAKLAA